MATTRKPSKPAEPEVQEQEAAEAPKWAFLSKEPSDLHAALAEFIVEETEGEVEITPRQVQALLAMHGKWQKSEKNRSRPTYRPRTVESIAKGGQTIVTKYGPHDEVIEQKVVEEPKEEAKPKTPARRTRRKTGAAASAA